MKVDLHILGGGPAGLATAHYARKAGLVPRVYEAGRETGGNCRTLRLGPCLYDTGAHRLHLRDPEAAAEFRSLLGDGLLEVDAPSAVVTGGKLLRFPPSPLDLFRKLGAGTLGRAALDLAFRRRPGPDGYRTFQDLAEGRYGKTLAELFLLNYTRKLWGRDPAELSAGVGGGRLKGLDFKGLLRQKLGAGIGQAATPPHLDGRFLYPRLGIGALFDAVRASLAPEAVRLETAVTRIHHDGKCILGVTLNGAEEVATPRVVSTLPLPRFLRALDPAPPAEILAAANRIAFRDLALAVLVLDRDRFSEYASLYFPDPGIPFTRVYEPKNRSAQMAPPGQTCLVLEIPCDSSDAAGMPGAADIPSLLAHLGVVTQVPVGEVSHSAFLRIPDAYPVLETGIEECLGSLVGFCDGFSNLKTVGRNARFEYLHIHDLFRQGAETVARLGSRPV